jgi:hypothetical protein
MRVLSRLVTVLMGGMIAASIGGTIAAIGAKRRIVPHENPDADEVAVVAIFKPLAFRSRARSFRGGTIDCWYGGGVVDLRGATLDPRGATLRVRAIFGGGQILVPDAWRVDAGVRGIGGLGDMRLKDDRPADAPQLTIEGMVLFGGFAVISELSPDQARWVAETEAKAASSAEHEDEPRPAFLN